MSLSYLPSFFYSQLFVSLPKPKKQFTGQTVIVTGSNTGLGLEAARYFSRLNAEKVILAVRNIEKGEAAKSSIEASTNRHGVVEVWPLDLTSYESVKQFVKRAEGLKRLDVLLENAGMMTSKFSVAEQDELTITTNVVSTFLLGLLLLPKLQETNAKFNVLPRLVIVTSDLHFLASFKERNSPNIFEELNNKETANLSDRYGVSKLLEVFTVRELAKLIDNSPKPHVIINCLTPGACYSDFGREITSTLQVFVIEIAKFLIARSTEAGSRTLVAAAAAGNETHGKYMADCHVSSESPFVLSQEGAETQRRVWSELSQKLENIQPGILQNI